jgi:hypothetical protein
VTISDSLAGSTIYYTTDGSTPTTSSAIYSTPIDVVGSETIRAIATASGEANSGRALATFTLSLPALTSYPAGLQFISLPESCPGVALNQIFNYNNVTLAVWDPASNLYDLTPQSPADGIVAGQGYWMRLPQAVTIYQQGALAPTNAPFVISLKPGWNMVGDPFENPVAISTLTFGSGNLSFSNAVGGSAPLIGSTVWGYDSSANKYAADSTLNPGQGYWVFAYAATTLSVPAQSAS